MFKNFFKKSTVALEEFCADPFKTVIFFAMLLGLFYTVQCSLLQSMLSLDTLEAFSRGADGLRGSSQQPPLAGWLTYSISYIGNHKDWILYFAGNLCMVISAIYVYKTAKLYFDEFASGSAALLCYFLFYYNSPTLGFSAYTLEMMLVPIASYNFLRALKDDKLINWAALSIFCAAGLLNGYSFIPVFLAFVIIFFRSKNNYHHLKNFKLYASLLFTLILLMPYIKYLNSNGLLDFKHLASCFAGSIKLKSGLLPAAMMIYPFVMMMLIMFLALLPDRRSREMVKPDLHNGINALLIVLVPAIGLLTLSLSGNVNFVHFCSMGALSAVVVISFFPYRIDKKFFTRLVVILELFSIIMMIVSTFSLLRQSNLQHHSNPEIYTKSAINFYNQSSITRIPVIVGTPFETAVLKKYLPDHPPVCTLGDNAALKRYQEKIKKEGALLIFTPGRDGRIGTPELDRFLNDMNYQVTPPIKLARIVYFYKARWGKRQKQVFYLGYLLPEDGKQSINIIPVEVK